MRKCALYENRVISSETNEVSVSQENVLQTEWVLPAVITGRNEVVAKVVFLHVCVILFTGGVSSDRESPPGQGGTPPDQADNPRPGRQPPLGRENPRPPEGESPPDQADTPSPPPPDQADHPPDKVDHPPRTRQTPPEQTPAYGLRAAVRILLECILVVTCNKDKLKIVAQIHKYQYNLSGVKGALNLNWRHW